MQKSLFEFMNVDLLSRAVKRVKQFVDEHRPRFVYAFYSGGKDSAVSTLATLKATSNVVVVYTEVVGNTHRLNIELVREFAEVNGLQIHVVEARNRARFKYEIDNLINELIKERALPCLIHIRAYGATYGDEFINALKRWGLPKGYVRWCHHEFKGCWWSELPFTRGNARHIIVGVRASESSHRMKRWLDSEGVRVFESRNGVDVALSPIYDFSDSDIYAILSRNFPKILKHYEKYGDSLNCLFCPLRSIEKQKRIVKTLSDIDWNRYVDALMEWSRNRKNVDESKLSKIIDALSRR